MFPPAVKGREPPATACLETLASTLRVGTRKPSVLDVELIISQTKHMLQACRCPDPCLTTICKPAPNLVQARDRGRPENDVVLYNTGLRHSFKLSSCDLGYAPADSMRGLSAFVCVRCLSRLAKSMNIH